MWLCWGENGGGRVKRLGGLLVLVSLAVVLVIVLLPKLSSLPRSHISPFGVPSTTAAPEFSAELRAPSVVIHGATAAAGAPQWGRLATFYVLAGRKDVHELSAQLAEAAGDCRSLPKINHTSSSVCGLRTDIYLLYADDDELRTAEAARNMTRYSRKISLCLTARRYASAVYAVVVCLSVRSSVCLSLDQSVIKAGIILKRLDG